MIRKRRRIALKILGLTFVILGIVMALSAFSMGNQTGQQVRTKIFAVSIGLFMFGSFLYFMPIFPANIQVVVVTIVSCMLLLEAALETFPYLISDDFANNLLSKYTTEPDGMFIYDINLNMNFLKPNFSTRAYFNRYSWEHKTDRLGFRNPVERSSADIVLLGDSFIYGHGADINQTVGYYMEHLSNYTVANLARQGDCSYEQNYVLNTYGLGLKPRYVIYFYFTNDVHDITQHTKYDTLTEAKIRKFISTPLQNFSFPNQSNIASQPLQDRISKFFKKRPYLFEALRYVDGIWKDAKEPTTNLSLGKGCNLWGCPRDSLPWNYTEKAIIQMDYASRL